MQRRRAGLPERLAMILAVLAASPVGADVYHVTVDPAVADEPVEGRLILFFITESGRRWARRAPMSAPFYSKPQPIASRAVAGVAPGAVVSLDEDALAFPDSIDRLDGTVRVQAVLDLDKTERGHEQGPGNLKSDAVTVTLSAEREDVVELRLDGRVEPPAPPKDTARLRWLELPSTLLSDFYGRPVVHRVGVALPPGYDSTPPARKTWPAIYVIPGFGGRHGMAKFYERGMAVSGDNGLPHAVWIVLDPESPLGHHGFVDSPNHGLRGTALVTEIIPQLEQRFALARTPAGRIVTGHSSGGWSSLWLQLRWPDVFGGCWASAPDPVDFRSFQAIDLYERDNLYHDEQGAPTPSMRSRQGDREVVTMTVRQECLMEHAIDPSGGSGQQWDAWEAMFSPVDPASGMPRPLFDAVTGRIDPEVVAMWRRFDINAQVTDRWSALGPIMLDRVRLVVGTEDSFYLEEAVERLRETVQRLGSAGAGEHGAGYIELIDGADHGSVRMQVMQRWNREIRAHLQASGLHD